MSIGNRIKAKRKELNMSVDELAKQLGKDRSTVYRYEKGDIEKLPIDILEPIAKALDTTPQYLMGWEEAKKPEMPPNTKGKEITLGDIIKSLRIDRHLTMTEFSEELGIPIEDLQMYENGSKQLPANIINAIASFFGLESEDITDRLLYSEDNEVRLSFRRVYVEQLRKWNREFGQDVFTEDELKQLAQYARFMLWQRNNEK